MAKKYETFWRYQWVNKTRNCNETLSILNTVDKLNNEHEINTLQRYEFFF